MTTRTDEATGWQSTVVAIGFLVLSAAVAVVAVIRYSVDDALKIWTPMIALLGVVAGAIISFFFTRSALQQARTGAAAAQARADRAELALQRHRIALGHVAARLDPEAWEALRRDQAVAEAADG